MKTPKEKSFISQQTYLSIYIYGSQTFWNFKKFYFVHIAKVCFVFQKTANPPYMHMTLKTSGTEK